MRATRAIATSIGARTGVAQPAALNRTNPARVSPACADTGTPTVSTTTLPRATIPLRAPRSGTLPLATTSYVTLPAARELRGHRNVHDSIRSRRSRGDDHAGHFALVARVAPRRVSSRRGRPCDACRQRGPRLLRVRRGDPERGQRERDRSATRTPAHGVLTFTVIASVVPYDGAVSVQSRIIRSLTPDENEAPLLIVAVVMVRAGSTAPAQLLVIDCQGMEASLGCHMSFEIALPLPSVAVVAQISTETVWLLPAGPPVNETPNVIVGPSMNPAT